MSYLVLARKWRPKNFLQTVGQEHVLRALTNALDSERLHHAYLFSGTRGVGKTTIARILAKALNCETGITSQPCGECGACREIDEGRFVDLIEVDAASNTKVDDTRDLLDNVQYAPARGRFKVYLIDEVHMLSKSSFNALLKTLEEPPPHVKFLLATTDPQKLPVTVLSRCLQFNLKRLTAGLIGDRLEHICTAEDVAFEKGALTKLSRAADGSLRDALSLLDQAIAFCGGNVTEDSVASMLGTIEHRDVVRLVEMLAASDARGLLCIVEEIDEQFPDYARLLDDLARLLQGIAVYQTAGVTTQRDDVDEEQVSELAGAISAEDVQLYYQIALLGRRDLYLAPDPRSGTEMTLLRMLTFRPEGATQPKGAVKTTAGRNGQQRDLAPTATKSTTPAGKTGAEEALSGNSQADRLQPSNAQWAEPDWADLVSRLDLTGLNKQLASNCAYLRREGDVVFLSLDDRSESYLTGPRQAALAQALSTYFSEGLKIDITVGALAVETPVQKDARKELEGLALARAGLEADPNVKALKDMFGAEIVADSVEPVSGKSANQEQ